MVNSHCTACALGLPAAGTTPAGTSTRYVVAIGKRPVGSNNNVRVPTQRHFPGGSGVRRTGTPFAARSSCAPTGTIGCEKVTLRCDASGTRPSGDRRTTVTGSPAATPGGPDDAGEGGGKDCTTV